MKAVVERLTSFSHNMELCGFRARQHRLVLKPAGPAPHSQQTVGRLRYQLLQGPDPDSLASRERGSEAAQALEPLLGRLLPVALQLGVGFFTGSPGNSWCDFFFMDEFQVQLLACTMAAVTVYHI